MGLLFVNGCLRKNSRTERLARAWLKRYEGEVTELDLAKTRIRPLDAESIIDYNEAVASGEYDDKMFDVARQFAQATDILIAAPLWNFALPAKLHDYLELVCSQGITFDIDDEGNYVSMCAAQRLTFIATSGGPWPEARADHAFGYVRTLAEEFWHIPEIRLVCASALDIDGADIEDALERALAKAN